MLRKTLVSIAVSGALYVSSSYGLELGELTSQSNLGEPYRGKIELSDVGNLTNDDILVRLGSESEFQQAGFAPTRVLSQLKFDVARENGKFIVAVSSDKPLRVDELHFILAARWPSGQVVREYQTPLNQSALVNKSKREVVQSASTSSASSNSSVFRQATMAAEKMSSKGRLGVAKGNTLWSIAGQNQPTNQLTIYQTMMAIQALNKDAFYSDNINLLKEGAILRLPTKDQIALFNKSISKE
ncbi:MAG: pilus assembly protein FimV, partial [Oceanospirillaceae bacterium]|nr:pilus assembly protein FimV [Oceanospirillaceae bacterium]